MKNWLFIKQVKEILGIDISYTGEDARLALFNASATKTLENLLGRPLTKAVHTEVLNSKSNSRGYYDVYGYNQGGTSSKFFEIKYYLKNYPIDLTQPFTVNYKPNLLIDGNQYLLADTDYSLDAEKGILTILIATGDHPRALTVSYTAGYDYTADPANTSDLALSASLPPDLVQAALFQVMHLYEKSKFSNINVRESRSQGITNASRYVNINAIAPEALAIIVQNKRRQFRIV
jgi:hypothetical protein